MDKIIYGADTETCRGEPNSLQFYSEDVACDEIFFVTKHTAMKRTLEWCAKRRRNVLHVVYVHNLPFDLPEFFYGSHAKLVSNSGEFDFNTGPWRIRGVYGAPTFCRITNSHDITVVFIDSLSFFRESLASWAAKYVPYLPKLPRVDGLGQKRFTARDTTFVEYAMRDAVIAYHMGRALEKVHAEFDIEQSLSVAHMAACVFRKKYLTYTIPQPSRDVCEAALLSYHGGKNGFTVEPGWYEGTSSLDISSAYPDALASFPAFERADLYREFCARRAARLRSVPDLGVYCISGTVAQCRWPAIFSHGFKPLYGDIDGVWVHGLEINEALRAGELRLSSVQGTYYDRDKDSGAPAFRNFVHDLYAKKATATDPILRNMYKLIQNSISGKLVQTRKRNSCAFTDIDADVTVTASELVAGGLFHPFIASATTAHTRARIHSLEHRYSAIHTATDGIMTLRKPKPEGKGLGSLVVEARNVTALLLRNKFYVLYADKPGDKTQPSSAFKGKHIVKYALHGFQGSVWDLERMIATGERTYRVERPTRLKESIKKGATVNDFIGRTFTLKLPPLGVHGKNRPPTQRRNGG